MNKAILIAIITILALALLWAIFNFSNIKNNRPELADEVNEENSNIFEDISDFLVAESLAPFRQLVSRPTIAPTFNKDLDSLLFFESASGRVYQIPTDSGREKLFSEIEIPEIERVTWSPNGDKSIIETNTRNFYYNYLDGQVVQIDNIKNPVFSPDGSRITWACDSGICEADPDGGNKKTILNENLKQLNMIWEGPDVYFYSRPSSKSSSPVFKVSPKTKNLNRVLASTPGLLFQTKNGQNLYSIRDDLYLDGTNLNLKTFASKCAFLEKVIYCAVPRDIPSELTLPDDYFKGKLKSPDTIYRIEKDGDEIKKSVLQRTSLQIKTIIPGSDILYLHDHDGSLHALEL